jgi:LPS-assembly protein
LDRGVISADKGAFNFNSETGRFERAVVTTEQVGYQIFAGELQKVSEFDYKLRDAEFSTCHCSDDSKPWNFKAGRANVTQEGYAHTYNTKLELYGVPVFYFPYFPFPAKTQRTSGLLVPEFGISSEDGFSYSQPIFWAVDDYTDLIFEPFIQTDTRMGMGLDFRKAFSAQNNIDGRFVYSDESQRGDDLRGTRVSDLFDPTFDEDRFGGYYNQLWRSKRDADIPLVFISDLHYVSDDLFLREMEETKIGLEEARFATSTALLRATLNDYITAAVAGEYNQAILTDDDVTFQRLPDINLTGLKSFRPFGFNPYGLKVVSSGQMTATDFVRDDGFDGWRYDVAPNLRMPFHYKNYFNSEIGLGFRHTAYDMADSSLPGSDVDSDFDTDRNVFNMGFGLSTAVERVFELSPDSWFRKVMSSGAENQKLDLARVKHTIEPLFRYTFIPDTSQDDLPLYDSLDRIRQKSLFTYGFRSALVGRFLPSAEFGDTVPELQPRPQDQAIFEFDQPLPDLGFSPEPAAALLGSASTRRGEVRNIATLTVKG